MQCPKCKYEPSLSEMQNSPGDCTKCGVNYEGHARHVEQVRVQREAERKANSERLSVPQVIRDVAEKYPGAQPVVVVDIKMGFWSMVVFMVKWVIATIPAAIILALIVYAAIAVAGMFSIAVTGFLGYKERFESSSAHSDAPPAQPAQSAGLIDVPVSEETKYYELGLSHSGDFVVMTVSRYERGGAIGYSRIAVNCKSAFAVVTAQAPTLDYLKAYELPTNYELVIEGSPRQYIAKHACSGVPGTHHLLR